MSTAKTTSDKAPITITDFRYATNYRYGTFDKYTSRENKPYDYKTNGIISKVGPQFLTASNNRILTQVMRFIDMQSITMLLCIEKVKKFKNYLAQ